MNELDKILDAVMKSKAEIIQSEAPTEAKEEFITALREKKKQEIIEEIKKEYKDELTKEINTEIKNEKNRQKINDLQSLMWSGFLLAFVVGLAVNQTTDIIGYFKGIVTIDNIVPAVLITVILCVTCIAAYFYTFIKNVLSLIDDFKEKTK